MLVSSCRRGAGLALRGLSRPALTLCVVVASCVEGPGSFFNDSSALSSGGATAAGGNQDAAVGAGNQTADTAASASGSGATGAQGSSGTMSVAASSSGVGGFSGSSATDGAGGGSGGATEPGAATGQGGGAGDATGTAGDTGEGGTGPGGPVTRTFRAPEDQLGEVPDGGFDDYLLCIDFSVMQHPRANQISDVRVTITVDMAWVGDLVITLEGPDGTDVTLLDERGDHNDLVSERPLTFSDTGRDLEELAATVAVEELVCSDGSRCVWHPDNGEFEDFSGESATGVWTLCFGDTGGIDVATVTGADLTIATVP